MNDQELKKYRERKQWQVFGLSLLIFIAAVLIFFRIPFYYFVSALGVFIFPLVIFSAISFWASHFMTKKMKPYSNPWEEAVQVFFRAVVIDVLILLVGGVIFFVTCSFLLRGL